MWTVAAVVDGVIVVLMMSVGVKMLQRAEPKFGGFDQAPSRCAEPCQCRSRAT